MSDYNREKVAEMVLALLYLNCMTDKFGTSAWKSFDWEAMDLLYEKGYIGNPKSKAKSVTVTEEGFQRAKELFETHFGLPKE